LRLHNLTNLVLFAFGWNLIGYSAENAFDISTATFTNTSEDTVTWANAIAQKKLYGYLAYYDSSPALAANRKYKYAAASGVDDTMLRAGKGYWLNARQAGTLTLPNVCGTLNTSTYAWSDLRFHNGTDKLNITQATADGTLWVQDELWYMGYAGPFWTWRKVTSDGSQGKNYFEPWEGYFIWGYKDNITLIRQN